MSKEIDFHSRTPTFHDTDAAYALPNDTAEHCRLTEQHNAFLALMKNRVVHAPVSSPNKVLDVGCGTGIVTRYLSTHFPSAEHVYGIDISPVPNEPEDEKPSNLSFIRGDFFKLAGSDSRLQFGSADFLFSRLLVCGITNWQGYVNDAFQMLKPGGWAEMCDYVEDVFYTDERSTPREQWEWLRVLREGGARKGLDMDAGLNIPRYMQQAGFVDIQHWVFQIPYWRKASVEKPETLQITDFMLDDKWGLFWHMIPKLVDGMGYTDDDIDKFKSNMRQNFAEEEALMSNRPQPPPGFEGRDKYEKGDEICYYRSGRWRSAQVLGAESSDQRYAIFDLEKKEIYHTEIGKMAAA